MRVYLRIYLDDGKSDLEPGKHAGRGVTEAKVQEEVEKLKSTIKTTVADLSDALEADLSDKAGALEDKQTAVESKILMLEEKVAGWMQTVEEKLALLEKGSAIFRITSRLSV